MSYRILCLMKVSLIVRFANRDSNLLETAMSLKVFLTVRMRFPVHNTNTTTTTFRLLYALIKSMKILLASVTTLALHMK